MRAWLINEMEQLADRFADRAAATFARRGADAFVDRVSDAFADRAVLAVGERAAAERGAKDKAAPVDWYSAACAGAWFLLNPSTWLQRHVEHLRLESDEAANRRLTVDIELPEDRNAAFRHDDDGWWYLIPVGRLTKNALTAQIDVRNENGDAVPLLTRAENGDISVIAYLEALEQLTGREPSEDMEQAVELTVYEHGSLAWLASGLIRVTAENEGLIDSAKVPEWDRLRRVAEDLHVNSFLWTVLRGHAGERRLIKFAYRTPLRPDPLLARRRVSGTREEQLDNIPYKVNEVRTAGVDWPLTAKNILLRALTTLCLAPQYLRPEVPALRGSQTYHFEVAPPGALEIRRLDLGAHLYDANDAPVEPQTSYEGGVVHLYVRGALRVESEPEVSGGVSVNDDDDGMIAPQAAPPPPPIRVEMALAVGRRGFLNLAVVVAATIAFGLWAFQAGIEQAQRMANSQTAGAVLLVVPALLIVFAFRPEEHAWDSRLLIGVRTLVLACGLLAAAGAAALAKVTPWTHVSTAFIWYASGATAITGLLLVSWAASWEPRRWWLSRTPSASQYSAGPLVALGAMALLGASHWIADTSTLGYRATLGAALTAALMSAAWWFLGWSARLRPHPATRLSALLAIVPAFAVAVADVGWLDDAVGSSAQWRDIAIGAGVLALVVGRRRLPSTRERR